MAAGPGEAHCLKISEAAVPGCLRLHKSSLAVRMLDMPSSNPNSLLFPSLAVFFRKTEQINRGNQRKTYGVLEKQTMKRNGSLLGGETGRTEGRREGETD